MQLTGAIAPHGRIDSLLGLRGLAALIVVVHHCMLRFPALTAVYDDPVAVAQVGSPTWWLVHTPLHLFWAGGEAVFVFFVLSGFVLTLPLLRPRRFDWRAYYPSRLVRLYVPVWMSIAWALGLFALTRTLSASAGAAWVDERHISTDIPQIILRSLVLHDSNYYNGPLWSIVWEVLFSLLLPIYFIVLVKVRVGWPSKLAATLTTTLLGAYLRSDVPAIGNLLMYMSMFAVGVLMAANFNVLQQSTKRLSSGGATRWNLWVASSLLLLCAYWFALLWTSNAHLLDMTASLQLVGAAGLVAAAIFDDRLRRFLESHPLKALGTISFSLYLVHDPLIAALHYLVGSHLVDFVVGIPLSLAIAWIFYAVIEHPSHRLAQTIARSLSRPIAHGVSDGDDSALAGHQPR
ncbi:acyltransferase [Curtobacterium sp. PhB78]|uniref:acyltransferase family protein n=1 Tax=Curtobacterium sp. PhB78 TaxID=2485102 RepID=UPI000F468680|nr:acyltransferase [Curtobacterium sp. PhB78]